MAYAKAIIPIVVLALLLPSLSFGARDSMKLVNGQKTWCVAKPSTLEEDLQKTINSVCTIVDCSSIKPNGNCFNPNVTISHASAVMNLYYVAASRNPSKCGEFTKSGLIVETDPSFGSCNYA